MKVHRNSPCPCGSGKKFETCCGALSPHLPLREAPPEAVAAHHAYIEKMQEEQKRYGHVRSVISADFQGFKFVAVGNELHRSEKWKTFPDFLLYYIKDVIGRDWYQAEMQKPEVERHQIVQWQSHLYEYQKLQQRGPDGLYAMEPDGVTAAYMLLAYDLYILRHHESLQDIVVRRLRNATQFQGARFELFVAATLIRCGCNLLFEDESDPATKHPELIATHQETGEAFDVEAKSRHRPGVLGFPGEQEKPEEIKLGVRRLLNRAAEKCGARPLAVFLDLNLSPELVAPENQEWLLKLRTEIQRLGIDANGVWPFALAIITNHPDHYGQFSGTKPPSMGYIMEPKGIVRNPLKHPGIADDIECALRQYGAIPNWFPDDFDM